jgi:hypothetical protein
MFKNLFSRRRADLRRNVDIGTVVRGADGEERPVRIVSLSARGFRLKGCAIFGEGAQIAFMLPGYGEVSGRVVWVADDECGGVLQSPIPIRELQLLETPA